MQRTRRKFLLGSAGVLASTTLVPRIAEAAAPFDIAIYGGTPSGIMAAYAAAFQGRKVALILGTSPLGGMPAQGLGYSDGVHQGTIGGFTSLFFQRVGQYYHVPVAYNFEPYVAREVFTAMLAEAGVTVIGGELTAAHRNGARILGLTLDRGAPISAKVFIDASYEGDLMAMAGASWTIGRESKETYKEPIAGFNACPTLRDITGYDLSGELYPGIELLPNRPSGSADAAVQSYGYRLCLSDEPANRRPWVKPPSYDADRYVPLNSSYTNFVPGPTQNHKFDCNTNVYGAATGYIGGTRKQRAESALFHRQWVEGWLYYLARDHRIPTHYRDEVNHYGLARDEFTETGNWPQQLYIREARRLVGRTTLTLRDLQHTVTKPDSIAIGSFDVDIHGTSLYAVGKRHTLLEGLIDPRSLSKTKPYQIPFRCLQPHPLQVDNLLVSVCVSASHIAWGSLRAEMQLMAIGEAAGTAASLAIETGGAVAKVDVSAVQYDLVRNGSIIAYG